MQYLIEFLMFLFAYFYIFILVCSMCLFSCVYMCVRACVSEWDGRLPSGIFLYCSALWFLRWRFSLNPTHRLARLAGPSKDPPPCLPRAGNIAVLPFALPWVLGI